jgi:hypothetical protein
LGIINCTPHRRVKLCYPSQFVNANELAGFSAMAKAIKPLPSRISMMRAFVVSLGASKFTTGADEPFPLALLFP